MVLRNLLRNRLGLGRAATIEQALDLHRRGELQQAEEVCRALLTAQPNDPSVLLLLGQLRLAQGDLADGTAILQRAIESKPDSVDAVLTLGMALRDGGRVEESLTLVDAAVARGFATPDVRVLRATLLERAGHDIEALAVLEQVLASDVEHAPAALSRAQLLHRTGRTREALEAYEAVLRLVPESVDALIGSGELLRSMGRFAEAIGSFDVALLFAPDRFEAAFLRALALHASGHYELAIAGYSQALAIKPDDPAALHNRAVVLSEIQRIEEALADFRRLTEIDVNYPHALGNVAYFSAQLAQWEDRARLVAAIEAGVRDGKSICSPLTYLSISHDAASQLRCARIHVAERHRVSGLGFSGGQRREHARIRVGYVSADLHEHAIAYLLAGTFEHHDRNRFEVSAYSLGPDTQGPMRRRLEGAFERFVDVRGMADRAIADLIREHEIDILVDLMGYTGQSRPDIFALRPAPVQVNYLGFPGTMGASFIDYILADRFVIPEESRVHYDESVVYLPDTFQANDSLRPAATATPNREALGLPPNAFIYCAFNNTYKIAPSWFDIWMRVLLGVEHSVLWLLGGSAAVERNLRREAEIRGVAPSRLIFAPKVPYDEYIARYRAADLFLDTCPFNGGTTVSDALWAGLPVLTCAGNAFAARMAGSLLTSLGLPELVTSTAEDYESLAIDLGGHGGAIRDLGDRLARACGAGALFDTPRFCLHLEAAYSEMWKKTENGERPSTFSVLKVPS